VSGQQNGIKGTMKAHLCAADVPSHALDRIDRALQKYAPLSVSFTRESEADVIVIPVIGRRDAVEDRARKATERGRTYVLAQYCIRSTKTPHTSAWLDLWGRARMVWSYYDLPALIREDGTSLAVGNFYRSPLGVEAGVFRLGTGKRPYLVVSSGQGFLTESARECAVAAQGLGPAAHLGRHTGRDEHVVFNGLPDSEVVSLYQKSRWVSGLRRTEGFELPAAEGLLCGARPILFRRSHYTHWYREHGEYIGEGSREEVIESLRTLFSRTPRPVTEKEREAAVRTFDWRKIVEGFWERVGA
jgi:hypothetical protein